MDKVVFDERNHKYFINNIEYQSVSSYIKKYIPEFEKEEIAERVARKEGKTKKQILKKWEEEKNKSVKKGHNIHKFAEKLFTGQRVYINPNDNNLYAKTGILLLHEKFRNIGVKILGVEGIIYSKKYKIAGTYDLLVEFPYTKERLFYDWKSNKELTGIAYNNLLPPFEDLGNIPYNKYLLQQAMYSILYEEMTGIIIDKAYLVHLHKDYTNFYNLYPLDLRDVKQKIIEYEGW